MFTLLLFAAGVQAFDTFTQNLASLNSAGVVNVALSAPTGVLVSPDGPRYH